MPSGHVFISHSSKDDKVISALCRALMALGVDVKIDSREFRPGDLLDEIIQSGIADAGHFIVVLSADSAGSVWVRKEIEYALAVRDQRTDGFRIIPVLLDPLDETSLPAWFPKEPIAARIRRRQGGIQDVLPDLLAALGHRVPPDLGRSEEHEATPIADLTLTLSDPAIAESEGKRRATAIATLVFRPAADTAREIESTRFRFTAPLGPIEADELAWYLERYVHWPTGVFRERAERVEEQLPLWGRSLYQALDHEAGRDALEDWKHERGATRRLTILVDPDPVAGATKEQKLAANEAATLLLSLPWELLHDSQGYLFEGARAVRVRRALPSRRAAPALSTGESIRVLLVSPRPEDEHAAFFDHRVSARPLADALSQLGELAELAILSPPTFPALVAELKRANDAGTPYHVVHFDGHGVYDRRVGLGALCFEDPQDSGKLEKRRSKLVYAGELADALRDHRVPLFFLDACQTAKTEEKVETSVAGGLLQGGVASVAAMSHSVLVETARRFVTAFYQELMTGARIGQAMLAGQVELKKDDRRGKSFIGELRLQDWFVPVLFQEEQDPQLLRHLPGAQVREIIGRRQELSLGELPAPPKHTFVGRSRELLTAERLLERERYAALRGEGGEGKTTLAAELARWLVHTRRFDRAAFVSLESQPDARAVLFALGTQLVPNFASRAGQQPEQAVQLIERALKESDTILVFDNMESILPPPSLSPVSSSSSSSTPPPASPDPAVSGTASSYEPKLLNDLFALASRLIQAGSTRLVFTSREPLPAPFDSNHVTIGRLDRPDAVKLVGCVLCEHEERPPDADSGESEDDIAALVEAVNCHARSLVVLAREVAQRGVRHATEHLHELMAALHAKYPDDRHRSLIASVQLSLARLPKATRAKLGPLAVFHGGGQLQLGIAKVLGLDVDADEELEFARQLIGVGLAEMLPYGYLRLDPALSAALAGGLTDAERDAARGRWAEAMSQLTGFLYQQRSKDPDLAATLTLLDLPNLLAALEHLAGTADPERVVAVTTRLEGLLQQLGRPKALARVAAIREGAARKLGEWSHAQFIAADAGTDRLLDAGRHAEAVAAAQSLLERAKAAGEGAYRGAAYDLAMAHFSLGRALKMSGAAEAALAPLREAGERFQKLAGAGNQSAARMASVCLTESGDCLRALGRLDEAAEEYQAAIDLDEKRGDRRDVAVGKGNLGTVRMLQRRYAEALAAWTEARDTFERLGEPASVATGWHQIGMVHQEAGQYEAAEHAYQESLRIKVRMGNKAGEASTLNQLGNIYGRMGRREDAVRFFLQAAEIYQSKEIADLANEGKARSNAADELIKLGRRDNAREELKRAIECDKPFGHASEPWKTFAILCNLERAVGDQAAAVDARSRAVQAYLAYRRDGGENQDTSGQVAERVSQAMAAGRHAEAEAEVNGWLRHPDLPNHPSFRVLLLALQALLAGSRDPALAADPSLDYDDAAEVLLLLERLGERPGA